MTYRSTDVLTVLVVGFHLFPMFSAFGYTFTERLGKGTYGEVFKAVHKWDSDYVYIFMEYLGGGDLSSFLKSRRSLPERTIRYFLQQLAFALHYLYERNIVHMDIKPQNILLTTSVPPVLKLADFGFAKSLEKPVKLDEIRGSLLYMAPEIFKFGVYEKACDLWSVGVILFECLFGKAPFTSATVEELKTKLLDNSPIRIPNQPAFSKDCIDLVSKLLKRKPSERIRHEQFFVHPFIDLAHAPSPQSIDKAIYHIMIADDLHSAGNLVDAYFNYKEGLTHLVSALQIESDSSRKQIIRSKLSQYIKVAEDLNRQLDDIEVVSPSRSARSEGITLPAVKSSKRPDPISTAVKEATPSIERLEQMPSSTGLHSVSLGAVVAPISIPPVSSLHNPLDARKKEAEALKHQPFSSSVLNQIRQACLHTAWFSFPTGANGSSSAPSASSQLPDSTQMSGGVAPASESVPQPVVKTAYEYAIKRLDSLRDIYSKEKPGVLETIGGLQRYYTFLHNNEYKAAMDYLQCNFCNWLAFLKGLKDLELQKTLRSELNEALTVAEKLKATLKAKGEITPLQVVEADEQACLIS
ncbi:Serine/threonine-protein kinase ULK3 [Taenia crassiceps]|uniref:Serine/threonine-protein kinase ULK3 n=1 Tax=Taenia crassiceps TaxID=6207 RepID=A0ABR4QST3_9CEST